MWFRHLEKRKWQLWRLHEAYTGMKVNKLPQVDVARVFGVDVRELRDYAKLVENTQCEVLKHHQIILDSAYRAYQAANGENDFRYYLRLAAIHFGVPHRPILELWDIYPNFMPSGVAPM